MNSKAGVLRTAAVLALLLVFAVSGACGAVAATIAASGSNSTGSPGTTTSQPLIGGEIWQNNSVPFATDAANSVILSMPTISSWLSSHSISIDELRPYLSLWPSQGNPYDYAQGTVGWTDNNTFYGVYSYILPNGTVIGVWVSQSSPRIVGSIYTYPSDSGDAAFTGYTVSNEIAAGRQAQDSNTGGSSSMQGAVMNTTVFSDLTNPSGCRSGNYCWYWGDWLGTSNYDWTSDVPSNAFFFQSPRPPWGEDACPTRVV